jgi:short-subunit dehydrogenase
MTRTVVITGATSGIGYATALRLAGAGYDVIGTARSAEKAAKLQASAREAGTALRTVEMDVANRASCVEGFEQIASMTADGGPWAVVNNAGIALPGAVADVREEDVRTLFDVNVLAPARIAALVLPAMRHRGQGRIVNVSSLAGRVSVPLLGWYSASKHALRAVNDALRMEAAGDGVHVVLVEPGVIATPLWGTSAHHLEHLSGSPYSSCYATAADVVRAAGRRPGPDGAARVIHRALAAPRPRSRYLVGGDARLSVVANALAPVRASDYVKAVGLGLRHSLPVVETVLSHWRRPQSEHHSSCRPHCRPTLLDHEVEVRDGRTT